MVKPEIYKGIEFIRISKLPKDEADQITPWSKSSKITILADSEIWRDCIQYKDYKFWYENHYRPVPNVEVSLRNESEPAQKRNFAMGLSRFFSFFLSKN